MPKPYPVRLVIQVLESKGFFFVSQTGSHAKYRKPRKPTLNVIVPIHEKDIRYGTFRSIVRQSRLHKSDFDKKNKSNFANTDTLCKIFFFLIIFLIYFFNTEGENKFFIFLERGNTEVVFSAPVGRSEKLFKNKKNPPYY
jgi:predicted RNA binding protein YcfA (HicA-like mRNA interferase family)